MKKNNSKVVDDGFVYQIQPAGGLDTKNEYFVCLGSVVMACVHVYEIPDTFSDFWLKKLTAVHGATAVVDYYTNPKINYAKQISSSISELEIQRHRAYSTTESDLIDQELLPLR